MTSATRTSPRKSDPPVSQTTVKPEPRSPSPLRSVSPSETTSVPTDPRDIDYRAHPELYKILRGEMNVFKTQPYSDELKVLWRFKDEATARRSSAQLYERFEGFRDNADFVGMDVTRKFIQMGRTRSLRYALRPGGRKYDKTTGQEMKRTGKVADDSKLKGAKIFEACLKRIEGDEVYAKAKKEWGKKK
ncbi:hypothetical protein NCC49_002862 [Naganishia albida]|nr:hypothetical protein NCC49_002862 [Naganishia albida]